MKIGIIGCGMISDIYLRNLIGRFQNTEVVACCATSLESSGKKAEQYQIQSCSLEDLLGNREIELVVNLTPPLVHGTIIRKALESGKHVYTEKPLAAGYQEAASLAALADEKGLYLGVAPDTFLGDGIQTAYLALERGEIGEITGFSISLNRRMEHFYERLPFTAQPGSGMGHDIGPYYFTALFSLLGPICEVSGMVDTSRPTRVYKENDRRGETYEIQNENRFAAVLRMRSGILGTIYLNGDSVFPEMPHFAIYGTKGILYLPNPDEFGGEVRILQGAPCGSGIQSYRTIRGTGLFKEDSRGLGVAEMVHAIDQGRPNRAAKEMGVHLVEVLDAIHVSSRSGRRVEVNSVFQRPEPIVEWEDWMGYHK